MPPIATRCGLICRESRIPSAAGTASGSSLRSGGTKKETQIAHSLPAHAQPTVVVFSVPRKVRAGWWKRSSSFASVRPEGSKSISPNESRAAYFPRPGQPVVRAPARPLAGVGASRRRRGLRGMRGVSQECRRKSFSTRLPRIKCVHRIGVMSAVLRGYFLAI